MASFNNGIILLYYGCLKLIFILGVVHVADVASAPRNEWQKAGMLHQKFMKIGGK